MRDLHTLAAAFFFAILLFALYCSIEGCHHPVCELRQTRCAPHDIVEVCDSRGQWRVVADCGEVELHSGGEWECGTSTLDGEEIHACFPATP